MKMYSDERGSIAVLAALSLTVLMSFLALAIDVGNLYYTQRQLQTLADSAAMAGALEYDACSGTKNCSVMQTAATTAFTENGYTSPTLYTQCAATSGTTGQILLTLNNAPCALGSVSNDPNYGQANYVEAVVSEKVPTYFAGIFGITSVSISARAEAGKSLPTGPCMDVTGTSGQTLTLNSGSSITDATGANCGVWVDSSGAPAVMENSGATVNVGSYNVKGSVTDNGGNYTPVPTTGASLVPDPFAAEITAGTLTVPTQPATSTTNVGTVSAATTLQPGTYTGLNFNGSGYTVTLAPGLYYFTGGINVGGVNLTGTGVTIYMASGQLNMNSASQMTLSAPTTGPQAGMLIWEAANNSSQMNLDSASNSSWKGAIYVPDAQLTLNGGSTAAAYGMVVAQSVMMNSTLTLSCTYMPGGVCPGSGGASTGSATEALAE
jgi:Flp pilus assembly protein TadG